MSRERKSLTFQPEILKRAEEVMRVRAFDELSDFVATLIREEYDRRRMAEQKPHSKKDRRGTHGVSSGGPSEEGSLIEEASSDYDASRRQP